MKKLLLLIIMSAMSVIMNAQSIGVGAIVSESYYKSKDDLNYAPIPLIDIEYGNFFIKNTELGLKVDTSDYLSVGAMINYNFSGVKAEDLEGVYSGIDDRDQQYEAGAFIEFKNETFSLKASFYTDISDTSDGSYYSISARNQIHLSRSLIITPYINYSIYDDKFVNYYYGISAEEATRTGLTAEEAFSGKKLNIGLTTTMVIDRNFSVGILANYNKLSDDFKTQLVKDETFFTGGVFLMYMWQ